MRRGRPYEIAIIGMGCRFAGASDLSSYFENILSARDCTREVPPDRWERSDGFATPSHRRTTGFPRAGAAISTLLFPSTRLRTESCRGLLMAASPNNSSSWTPQSPHSRMPG